MKKNAIVTGASSGLGGVISMTLAKHDYNVALVGRSESRLSAIKAKIDESGGTSKIFLSDLSTLEGINKLINEIKSDTKQVDILVNAAAIWHGENEAYAGQDFDTFTQRIVTDTMMVGIMAPTMISHALIPLMPSKSKIINISGTFENGGKGWIPYFVSKRALEDLTIGLAEELVGQEIQVNAISPSDTNTPAYAKFFPEYVEESIDPQEIANQVIKLISSAGDSITGQVFVMKKDIPVVSTFHS